MAEGRTRGADDGPLEDLTDGAGELLSDPIGAAARTVWWLVLLRGVATVAFGVLAIVLPAVALLAVVFVFAAFAIVDGVLGLVHAIRARSTRGWGWHLVQSIIALLAGIVAFTVPGFAGVVAALVILWMIALYSVLTGALGIPAAATLVADGGRKALAIVTSVLSLLFGVLLMVVILVNPAETALSFVWLVGIWAVVIGVMLIVLAVQARLTLARATPDVPSV